MTPKEVRALAEYVEHGLAKEAAACLGVTLLAFKHTMTSIHGRAGVDTTLESLHRLGWVTLPPGALLCRAA